MLRIASPALLALCLLVPGIAAAEALDVEDCRSGQVTLLHADEAFTLLSFEANGILRTRNANTAWDAASIRCVGVTRAAGEDRAANGLCKWQDADGDLAFAEWEGAGFAGGTWAFLGGTGKWQGLTGSGEWSYLKRARPIQPGTFQACIRIHGDYARGS